jgi:pectate lyase
MNNRFWNSAVISFLCIAIGSLSVRAQTPYYMASPIGYGAGTTGGGAPTSSNTVTVSSSSELSSALSGSKSVILVSGTITTGRIGGAYTDKTIIGLPGAKLTNLTQNQSGSGILELKSGSSNIIIRNLIFVGPGAYDCDGSDLLTNVGCTKLWVDHCEFQDGVDGNFDNTKTADNITISWCKFTYLKSPKAGGSGGSDDHRFTNLVGGSDTDVPGDGKYSITWLNCWWADGCVDRMARARNAQLDMISCYWNSKTASKNIHLSPGTNGTYVYVDNGVFACSGDIVNFEKTGNNNVKFVNCIGGGSNTGSVSAPSYSYSATPAGSVAGTVANTSCGAGATLKVTAEGVISSSCAPTGVTRTGTSENKNSPVIIDNNLNPYFSASRPDNAGVTFYSLNGRKVCNALNNGVQPDIRGLAAGVYFASRVDLLSR